MKRWPTDWRLPDRPSWSGGHLAIAARRRSARRDSLHLLGGRSHRRQPPSRLPHIHAHPHPLRCRVRPRWRATHGLASSRTRRFAGRSIVEARRGGGRRSHASLGIGRVSIRIPCRVVYVIDEPNRMGFAYGTLPGHPVSGEELFLVQRNGDGRVTFTVSAFSRPATTLTRVAGPVTRWAQSQMMGRYPRALNRP